MQYQLNYATKKAELRIFLRDVLFRGVEATQSPKLMKKPTKT